MSGRVYIHCGATLAIPGARHVPLCGRTPLDRGLQPQNSACHARGHGRELPQLLLLLPCLRNSATEVSTRGHPRAVLETWQQGMLEHQIFLFIHSSRVAFPPHPFPLQVINSTLRHSYPQGDLSRQGGKAKAIAL